MGLFTAWVAYRAGRRRQQRQHEESAYEDDEICENCGHRRAQHSDEGRCPTYD